MSFAQAFIDEMREPHGELLKPRVLVRLNDGQNRIVDSAKPGDGSPWVNSAYIVKDSGTSESIPGGALAYRWETITGASSYEYLGQDFTCGGRRLILSAYVKDGNAPYFALRMRKNSDGTYYRAVWGWLLGVLGELDQDLNILSKGRVNLGSGWYFIWIMVDADEHDLIGEAMGARFYPAEQESAVDKGCYIGQPALEFHDDPTIAMPGRYIGTTAVAITGQIGRLITVTDEESILSLNPISAKREKAFGVVSGQRIMAAFTNENLVMMRRRLAGCTVAIRAGFEDADLWETMAQGIIDDATATTDLEIAIEAKDATVVTMDYELEREIGFFTTGYNSPLYSSQRSATSREYRYDPNSENTNDPLPAGVAADMRDETVYLEFTSATAYKIILEDGDETQTSNITTNATFYGIKGSGVAFGIPLSGWDTTGGAYTAGDRFVLYSSELRTTTQLSPINMIAHLIEDVAGIRVMDVVLGQYYDSPLYDKSGAWTAAGAAVASDRITGVWEKGTKLRKLIQDALKVCHGSIFPTHTGQIGVWLLQPSSEVDLALNGDFAAGPVNITSAAERDNLEDLANRVTYEYKTLYDGEPAYFSATDADSGIPHDMPKTIEIGWRVSNAVIEASANKYLNRFSNARFDWQAQGLLGLGSLQQGAGVTITDPVLDLSLQRADITETVLDVLEQEARISAYADPVSLGDYARVSSNDPASPWYNHSVVGGPKKVW